MVGDTVEGQYQGLVITPDVRWSPALGSALHSFLDHVPEDAREKVADEALEILSRGTPTGEKGRAAGLVVGYIQSGKTMSFTATAAAARDNGYSMVIVIAGTSKNLLGQTRDRLVKDLDLDRMDAYRHWIHVESPKPGSEETSQLIGSLEDWREDGGGATVLVTVMKQHRHLEWLERSLQEVAEEVDLADFSVLVVDDEADQATPNRATDAAEESATYARLRRVRSFFPSHTLLQYTATPQATLLVSLTDEISPDFVCVIEPGEEYTGGRYFFTSERRAFVRPIPESDLEAVEEGTLDPPRTLLAAFANFLLGCAATELDGDAASQRSMLVHPSQRTLPHAQFVRWLKRTRDTWRGLLGGVGSEYAEVADEIRSDYLVPAYEDLQGTVPDIPALEALVVRLPRILRKLRIEEVNAVGGGSEINWQSGFAWVLVGGTLLDRGFTVEGLTVTYMPRGVGGGMADTVQQRARFFGYKRAYAHYCRAWMPPDVEHAFIAYVEHEETMRKQLVDVAATGTPLKEWKRKFLLDKRLTPTRSQVIRLPLMRFQFGARWFQQGHFDVQPDVEIVDGNRALVSRFLEQEGGDAWPVDGDAGGPQSHADWDLALPQVLDGLLTDYVMTGSDSERFTALRILLEKAAEDGAEVCRVIRMGPIGGVRERSMDEHGAIKELFQGRNPSTGYPGDRAIHDEDRVSVQIHSVDLLPRGSPVVGNAPVLAVWVPARLDQSVLFQA